MKKLIEALHVIQDECNKHDNEQECVECPMWSEVAKNCCVTDLQPCNWEINDDAQRALL